MIAELALKNFKCFPELSLPLGPLTLLTGLNGMGKSTVLQAILALLQSDGECLSLNGSLVQLGTAGDVLYEGAQSERIAVALDAAQFEFAYGEPGANDLHITPGSQRITAPPLPAEWQYLNCERIGPRSSFAMSDTVVRGQRRLGPRGEFAAHFLAAYGDEPVSEGVRHPSASSASLRSQLDAWMGLVSPGARLSVVHHTEMDLVRLSVAFADNRVLSKPHRPTNVGFGIAYLLPVLVAGLAARPGSLLMIENPEAHLHPRGQARMGDFLARVARSGVQVIVETHSDHLVNGVRIAVHAGEFPADSVAMHFFSRRIVEERFVHEAVSPRMDRNGRIDQWPSGFFDEWDHALDQLLFPAG
jgi:predicted ATPase